MHFFEMGNIAVEIWGYPISFVELIGTLFGYVSVYFAARANILTWPTGIVNVVFLFFLFLQVQLYADLFLQIYFFIVTLYGWYNWDTKSVKIKISETSFSVKTVLVAIILTGTLVSGFLFTNIHVYLTAYFKLPAAYPFMDSFVMVSSIVATVLLAKNKIENCYLWVFVDIVCVFIYYKKGIYFLSLEYLIFLGLVFYGLYHWRKKLLNALQINYFYPLNPNLTLLSLAIHEHTISALSATFLAPWHLRPQVCRNPSKKSAPRH